MKISKEENEYLQDQLVDIIDDLRNIKEWFSAYGPSFGKHVSRRKLSLAISSLDSIRKALLNKENL